MLKSAIYTNTFILLLMSILFRGLIYLFVKILDKKAELKNLKKILVIYIILNLINFILYDSDIVEIGWDFFYLLPISITTFVLCITGIDFINKKINESDDIIFNNSFLKNYIITIIIPILIFIIPYMYELYVINNCDYLLTYNYQNGIVISDTTYIAIMNNKPITITLQKNLFDRKGVYINELKNIENINALGSLKSIIYYK